MRRVNRILKKNFQIMKDLLNEEKYVKLKKIELEKKGMQTCLQGRDAMDCPRHDGRDVALFF